MNVYGITMDFEVKLVRLGSAEMMACREVQMTEQEAKRRAEQLRRFLADDSDDKQSGCEA